MKSFQFPPSFLLLQQEGYLIYSCLTQGLNALRNANLSARGNFYIAFFQLSIGLERLMKASVIIDYMAGNALATPPLKTVTAFRHDLLRLFGAVSLMDIGQSPNPLTAISSGSIEYEILKFLNEFANSARYFNLDTLGAQAGPPNNKTATVDPLAAWDAILTRILIEDCQPNQLFRIAGQSAMLAQSLKKCAIVVGHDLNGKPLDVEQALAIPRYQDTAARYAVLHVVQLIARFAECLDGLEDRARPLMLKAKVDAIPRMIEFLSFSQHERAAILRKKRWP